MGRIEKHNLQYFAERGGFFSFHIKGLPPFPHWAEEAPPAPQHKRFEAIQPRALPAQPKALCCTSCCCFIKKSRY